MRAVATATSAEQPLAQRLETLDKLLAEYHRQNAECRNRLYADLERQHATRPAAHPLLLLLLGGVLGAIATALVLTLAARRPP